MTSDVDHVDPRVEGDPRRSKGTVTPLLKDDLESQSFVSVPWLLGLAPISPS